MALSRWENEGGATSSYHGRVEEPERRDEESVLSDGAAHASEGDKDR